MVRTMRPAAQRFQIVGPESGRPEEARVIFADGAEADGARAEGDIELSHWVPNTTDQRYKADTSTEICLRFVADGSRSDFDVVVNDHVDVDGILSLFVLLHPDISLEHRDVLIGAAEMGDFLAWADRPGFVLAQELWRGVTATAVMDLDPVARYELGFSITGDVLRGVRRSSAASDAGWACIEAGLSLLESGTVATSLASERLVSFVFPPSIDARAAMGVPVLNQLVDDSIALWPQVRNRIHGQRMQLLSAPAPAGGWFHDVWAPAYTWAETPGRWPMPGLVSTGDSNRWLVQDSALDDAVLTLQHRETSAGSWVRADSLTPFEALAGRRFPVLVSCVDEAGDQAPSTLDPDEVLDVLAPVWPDSGGTVRTDPSSMSSGARS